MGKRTLGTSFGARFVSSERTSDAAPEASGKPVIIRVFETLNFSEQTVPPMREDAYYDEDDESEDRYRGPSKSQLKREQLELQDLGKEMTKLGDDQLKRIDLPEDVLVEILEFRRMRSFGAQRRQLQLIGKKMRNMDPKAVREAIDRATGESKAAVALLHRCETLREQMIADDKALTKFIDEHPGVDIQTLRGLVRNARRERELQKPPKSARELYKFLHALLDESVSLYAPDDEDEEDGR